MTVGQLIALVSTHFVIALYGAGVKRSFGSLSYVDSLPITWRLAKWPVLIADWLFVGFVLAVWVVLLVQGPVVPLLIVGLCLWPVVEIVTRGIRPMTGIVLSGIAASVAASAMALQFAIE